VRQEQPRVAGHVAAVGVRRLARGRQDQPRIAGHVEAVGPARPGAAPRAQRLAQVPLAQPRVAGRADLPCRAVRPCRAGPVLAERQQAARLVLAVQLAAGRRPVRAHLGRPVCRACLARRGPQQSADPSPRRHCRDRRLPCPPSAPAEEARSAPPPSAGPRR